MAPGADIKPMDGLPEGQPPVLPSCRTTVYVYRKAGFLTVGRSCIGDGRCELMSCLARRGTGQGEGGRRGKSLDRDETETGRRGDARRGRAAHGGAGRSHVSEFEFLAARKGLAAGCGERGRMLW